MKINNVILAVISVTVCVLMVGGALLPMFSSVTVTDRTFDNSKDALFEMENIEDISSYTFRWDPGNNYCTINDTKLVFPTDVVSYSVVCVTDDLILRYHRTANVIQVVGEVFPTGQYISIVIENNILTLSNGAGTEIVKENPTGYVMVPDGGHFVMKSPTQEAYIFDDTPILGMGLTTIEGAWDVGFSIKGTIDNIAVTQFSGVTTYTVSNIVTDYTVVDGYNNLNKIKAVTFDVANATTEFTGSVDYNYFVVPISVTADLTEPMAEPLRAMFSIIPIMAVAGLVVTGVYVFISRK